MRGNTVGEHVRRPVARPRGFTLLELIAVVTVIAVFASLAIPSALGQLRSRRVQEAARQIGIVYREARLRALGRGSAVLVRVNGGAISVLEATVGGVGNCANLPVSSCLTPTWSTQRVVGGFSLSASGDASLMSVAFSDSGNTAVGNLDICFTPMGRAFSRNSNADGVAFAALTETYTATVSRPGTRRRQVVLMPNGTARLN